MRWDIYRWPPTLVNCDHLCLYTVNNTHSPLRRKRVCVRLFILFYHSMSSFPLCPLTTLLSTQWESLIVSVGISHTISDSLLIWWYLLAHWCLTYVQYCPLFLIIMPISQLLICAVLFFSVPVSEQMQPIFAFTFKQKQYTWTCLCSLPLCILSSLVLPYDCALLQYTENILLSAVDSSICTQGSLTLLTHLAHCGFKALQIQ